MIYLMVMEERAKDLYIHGMICSHLRAMYMDRCWSFLDSEQFIIIFRMSQRSMEQPQHELYPFLRVHLMDAQIDGQVHRNIRPLTVDEKLAIGLMTAGECPLGGTSVNIKAS
jgi:hypothetical protein